MKYKNSVFKVDVCIFILELGWNESLFMFVRYCLLNWKLGFLNCYWIMYNDIELFVLLKKYKLVDKEIKYVFL